MRTIVPPMYHGSYRALQMLAQRDRTITTFLVLGCPKPKADLIFFYCEHVAQDKGGKSLESPTTYLNTYVSECKHRLSRGDSPSEVFNWIADLSINPD